MGLFWWLTGFSMLLRASLSLYAVASNAMVAEMTRRYDERTEVIGFRFLFGWLAGLTVAVIGYMGFFAPGPGGSDGRLDPSNYVQFGLFCGLVCGAGVFLCARGTHRLIPTLRQPTASQHGVGRFFRELREVLSNPSFRALLGAAIFSAAAWGYINAVGYYMNTYFWALTSREIGSLTLAMFVSVLLAGLTLDLVRFPRQLDIADMPAGSVDALGYVVGPGITLLFVVSTLCLLFYRMSRSGHQQILRGLAEKPA